MLVGHVYIFSGEQGPRYIDVSLRARGSSSQAIEDTIQGRQIMKPSPLVSLANVSGVSFLQGGLSNSEIFSSFLPPTVYTTKCQ